jgi:LysR family transcriptional activator of glutamate synthase operon
MQLDDLRWFLVAAETEHLTEAADIVGTTQPTLTRSLQRTERHFGTTLFERHHRGVRLNSYGQLVLDQVREALTLLDRAHERVTDLTDPDTGTVRLAFMHSAAATMIPDLIRRFRATTAASHVSFALRQETSHDIRQDLDDGQADLGISARPTHRSADYHWCLIERQRLFVCLPQDHRLADRRRLRLSDVRDEPFVTLRPEMALRRVVDNLCRTAGFTPSIVFECSDLTTIGGLVGGGLGVAVLPVAIDHPTTSPAGAVQIPLTGGSARRDVGLVWRRSAHLPPVACRFRDFIVADSAPRS